MSRVNFGEQVSLIPATVPLCLALLAVITVLNLCGLGDAARAFLLLTMVFIVAPLAIIAIGLVHPLGPHAGPVGWLLLPVRALTPAGLVPVLKAFSAGCSALTGMEAIANGVPLFKPPRVRRAKRTELLPRRDPGRSAAGPGGAGQPLATNNHLPHLYALRDDRQVFASGIWTLAVLSGTLLVAVREG